ncbi:MAG TPA: hypothetical protein VNS09_26340 [Solirubrobacter sp.]|nr:hypothetical protein [Solirubrobacter sp.]
MSRTWTCLRCGVDYANRPDWLNPFYCGERCDAEQLAEWIAAHSRSSQLAFEAANGTRPSPNDPDRRRQSTVGKRAGRGGRSR